MVTPLTPEGASSWFKTFYGITEKSTPITLAFILAIMIVGGYFGGKHIQRLHSYNEYLYKEIQGYHTQMIDLALKCRQSHE